MSEAFLGTMIKKLGKGQNHVPCVFAAPPDVTDEDMLEQALWLKKNGFRVDLRKAFVPSPMATTMYHAGGKPLPKVTPGSEGVYIPRGLRQRRLRKQLRLQKAFLCFHDPDHWPMLRGALRRMGRADLIGSGKHQLVPARQPDHQKNLTPEVAQQQAA